MHYTEKRIPGRRLPVAGESRVRHGGACAAAARNQPAGVAPRAADALDALGPAARDDLPSLGRAAGGAVLRRHAEPGAIRPSSGSSRDAPRSGTRANASCVSYDIALNCTISNEKEAP